MKTNFGIRTLVSGLAYGVAVLFLMTACQKEPLEVAPTTKAESQSVYYKLVLAYAAGSSVIQDISIDPGSGSRISVTVPDYINSVRWTFFRDGTPIWYDSGRSVNYYGDTYFRVEVSGGGPSELREYKVLVSSVPFPDDDNY